MNLPDNCKTLSALAAFTFVTLPASLGFADEKITEAVTTTTSIGASLASQETTVPGGVLLITAYIVLWLLLFGYLAFIMRRQQTLSKDLESLEKRIDEVLGINEPL